jgi:hypothetical protein
VSIIKVPDFNKRPLRHIGRIYDFRMEIRMTRAQRPGLTINPVCNPGGDIQLHLATIYSSLDASRQYFHPENIQPSHRHEDRP